MDADGPVRIAKRDALGRVTVSREQREALLDEFEHSGLKGAQFARAVGVNYQTFASWVQKSDGMSAAPMRTGASACPRPKPGAWSWWRR